MAELGTLAFQVAGSVIGGFFGGPIGASIGGTIGGVLGNAIFGSSQSGQIREGPRLQDLTVSSSAYGAPVIWVFGTQRVPTNMIWATDIIEIKEETTVEGATGKGGGGGASDTYITYKYQANAAFLCGRGPKDIIKIWADVKLIHNAEGSGQFEGAKFTGLIARYQGSTTQEPDPTMQTWLGVTETPAYRDYCYFVIHDFPLEDFGNRIPQMQALITDGTDNLPYDTLDYNALYGTGTTGAGSLFNASWSNDHRYLVINGDSTIDSLTQQVVNRRTEIHDEMDGMSSSQIRRLWNDYLVGFAGLSTSYVNVVDPETMMGVATSGGLDMDFAREVCVVTSPIPPLDGGAPAQRIVAFGLNGNATVFDPAVTGNNVTAGFLLSATFPQMFRVHSLVDMTIAFPPPTDSSGWNGNTAHGSVADRDGYAWVCIPAGGGPRIEFILAKFDPWSGTWVSSTTVPGGNANDGGHISYDPILHKIAFMNEGTWTTAAGVDDGMRLYDIDSDTWDPHYASVVDDIGAGAGIGNDNGTNTNGKWADTHKIWVNLNDLSNDYAEYDFSQHKWLRKVDTNDWTNPPTLVTSDSVQYDPIQHAIITLDPITNGIFYWLYLDRKTKNGVTLKSVVDDISAEVGLDLTEIDTADLAVDTVRGYAISRRTSARSALEPLRAAYFFDAAESDFIMKFVYRGGDPVVTLTDDDLGAANGIQQEPLISETRLQEVELPAQYDIIYTDQDFEYQQGDQHARRADEAVTTVNQLQFEAPIVFTASEALNIVERLLYEPWVERDLKQFKTTWQQIALDPTDVVAVSLADGTYFECSLRDVDQSIDVLLEFQAVLLRPELQQYRADTVGADPDGVNAQQIIAAGGSNFFVLDMPLLQDIDDGVTPIYYTVAGRNGGADGADWDGARIDRSVNGADFVPWTFHGSSTEMSYGRTNEALPLTNAPFTWDRTNTLNVRMINGTLSSTSEANVLNGANAALVGNEVIQFADVTLEMDGTYTLSNLLRGRRGTDLWARDADFIAAHSANERFVLLTAATVQAKPMDTANIDTAMSFKSVPIGSIGTVYRDLTPKGYSKYPYAPHRVEGTRDGSGNLTITWARRTRTGGAVDWPAGPAQPPVTEAYEQYEIDIIDVNGVVVRTIVVDDAQTTTYTAAQQNTDFGTDLDPINDTVDFIVYQMSDIVGRGFPSLTTTA